MSAFTVGSDHIDLMVTAAMKMAGWNEKYINIPKTADLLGQDLLNENYASVNHRYTEQEEVPAYSWTPVSEYQVGTLSTMQLFQVLNAAHCYDYQSCEHPAWSDSKAYWTSQAIQFWVEKQLAERGLKKVRSGRPGDTSEQYPGMRASDGQILWEWSRVRAAEIQAQREEA